MRPSIGRLTLRGARAVASTSTRKKSLQLSQHLPRDLCTSSAVSPDPTRKPEPENEIKDDRLSMTEVVKDEPAIQVLTEEPTVSSMASEPMAADGNVLSETADALGATTERHSEVSMANKLGSLLRKNTVRSALWEYSRALKEDGAPSIDAPTLKLMLPVMGRNSWGSTAEESLELIVQRGYQLPAGVLNCGLHAMSRAGKAEEIEKFIEQMWSMSSSSHPNATSYTYLIGAYIYRGGVDEAFNVLNEMKKHLIYPTFATYHALVTGCLRRRDPRRAYQTLIAVEKQRFDISAMTVAQVLVASANNDDYDHVLHLLSKFEECLPRYSSELHRIAESRALYRLNTAERTTKEDREVLRGDPKPEIGALSAVLHCAFRGGRIDLAFRAWQLLEEYYPDYEPPAALWYCMIGAYAGAGEFSQAIDFVGIMREKGLKPSMKDLDMALVRPMAYDVSVIDEQFYRLCDRAEGKEENGNMRAAAAADDKMDQGNEDSSAGVLDTGTNAEVVEEDPAAKDLSHDSFADAEAENQNDLTSPEQISGDVNEYSQDSTSTSTAQKSSSLSEAVLHSDTQSYGELKLMKEEPTSVGIEEVNCIIAACSAAQDLDRAFQTYDEVETRFKLERNIDTLNALLEGCVQTRRLSGGQRVLEEIDRLGLQVSSTTLHLACRLMLRSGKAGDVELALTKAHENGSPISTQTYQMALRHFCRGGDFDAAVRLFKQGLESGYAIHALTGRFDMSMTQKLREAAFGETNESDGPEGGSEDALYAEEVAGDAEEVEEPKTEKPEEETVSEKEERT
eukprot:GFKZ01006483.1.p1 GENE.GFKZ01006483.1~~GFKZ01006483.1.p1  ORF type:complete len:794 (-),score=129.45 GFKZ01006483.1:1115-3496(-)